MITGPATKPYSVTHAAGDAWIGARLRPQMGAALWGERLAQAVDTALRGPAALARHPSLTALTTQAPTLPHLAKIVAQITAQTTADKRLTRALDLLHTSGGRMPIDALATAAHCSARHLSRLFVAQVGLPPKTYAQLIRINRTLRLLEDGALPLIAAAQEAGFSDQAHLTRACRRYAGFAPTSRPSSLTLPSLAAPDRPMIGAHT